MESALDFCKDMERVDPCKSRLIQVADFTDFKKLGQ